MTKKQVITGFVSLTVISLAAMASFTSAKNGSNTEKERMSIFSQREEEDKSRKLFEVKEIKDIQTKRILEKSDEKINSLDKERIVDIRDKEK